MTRRGKASQGRAEDGKEEDSAMPKSEPQAEIPNPADVHRAWRMRSGGALRRRRTRWLVPPQGTHL